MTIYAPLLVHFIISIYGGYFGGGDHRRARRWPDHPFLLASLFRLIASLSLRSPCGLDQPLVDPLRPVCRGVAGICRCYDEASSAGSWVETLPMVVGSVAGGYTTATSTGRSCVRP
jgi:hypothetical protein